MNPEERQKIHDELVEENEYQFDIDNPPKVEHQWVERGTFISCEGAGHPNHRHHIRK